MASLSTFAQGTIDFSWTGGSGITIGSPSNPSSQLPGWFLGGDYSVQAYMASGTGAAESSLSAVGTAKTTFLGTTGPTQPNGEGLWFSGAFSATPFAAGVPDTIQIRAWYDPSHNTSYEQALANNVNTGKSALLTITPADPSSPSAQSMDTIGLAAFTVTGIVPEPSTFALAGLGAAAMLIFRRRK